VCVLCVRALRRCVRRCSRAMTRRRTHFSHPATHSQFVIRYQCRGRGVAGGSAIVVGGRAASGPTRHRPS